MAMSAEIEKLSQAFGLADPSRLRILHARRKRKRASAISRPPRNLRVGGEPSAQAAAHHAPANRREGTVLYYRLLDRHVPELIALALLHLREE
jgi:DNA-binding transcriptional ArsR family regulator